MEQGPDERGAFEVQADRTRLCVGYRRYRRYRRACGRGILRFGCYDSFGWYDSKHSGGWRTRGAVPLRPKDGLLRYVASPSRCALEKGELLELTGDGPVYACASGGERAFVRRVADPSECSSRQSAVTISGDEEMSFCVGRKKGRLHYYADGGECPNRATVLAIPAVNDSPDVVSVTEDGPVDEGSSATVTATATDPEGDTLSYEFDCNGDGDYDDPATEARRRKTSPTCSFDDSGVTP